MQLGLDKDFQESFSKGVDNIQQGQLCVGSFSNTALCNPSGQSLGWYDLQGQLLWALSCSRNRESGLCTDTFGTVFRLRIKLKASTGYSASLSFLGCPMRSTSSWVNERSSQYLIYLVILSNSQPRNQFLHIEKKNSKNFFKISKQNKNIDIYSNIANQSNYKKCQIDLILISNLKPLGPSASLRLSPSLSVSLCLSLSLSVSLCLSLSLSVSLCLSLSLSVSLCLSLSLSVSLCLSLSLSVSLCLSLSLSATLCLSLSLSVCIFDEVWIDNE